MTYKELALSILNDLTTEQQEQTATFYMPGIDEYFPVYENFVVTDEDNDVLDVGHIVLTLE